MNNFIEIYKNSLSKKSCDYIINCFSEHEDQTHVGKLGGQVDIIRKDSLDLNLLKIRDDSNEFLFQELKSNLRKNLNTYINKYPFVPPEEKGYNFFEHHSLYPFTVLAKKYKKNKQGYHIFHMDQGRDQVSIHRQLICMYYLNDVNKGGETEFYHQKVKLKPKKGSLVIFPAFFTHLHKGHIPVSDDKYILNFWLMMGRAKELPPNGFEI